MSVKDQDKTHTGTPGASATSLCPGVRSKKHLHSPSRPISSLHAGLAPTVTGVWHTLTAPCVGTGGSSRNHQQSAAVYCATSLTQPSVSSLPFLSSLLAAVTFTAQGLGQAQSFASCLPSELSDTGPDEWLLSTSKLPPAPLPLARGRLTPALPPIHSQLTQGTTPASSRVPVPTDYSRSYSLCLQETGAAMRHSWS